MALLVLTKGCFHGVGDQDPEAGVGGAVRCTGKRPQTLRVGDSLKESCYLLVGILEET